MIIITLIDGEILWAPLVGLSTFYNNNGEIWLWLFGTAIGRIDSEERNKIAKAQMKALEPKRRAKHDQ